MRTIVGASSGLGRCIGVGLAQRGLRSRFLARRREKLESRRGDRWKGVRGRVRRHPSGIPRSAIDEAVEGLGGLDALVYTPAIGPLGHLVDLDADTWGRVFATNVTGAALVTAAAVPHLQESVPRSTCRR